jgi:hypothetical protein
MRFLDVSAEGTAGREGREGCAKDAKGKPNLFLMAACGSSARDASRIVLKPLSGERKQL